MHCIASNFGKNLRFSMNEFNSINVIMFKKKKGKTLAETSNTVFFPDKPY